MSLPPAGYSGKPLIQKLGLKPGETLAVLNAPPHYAELVAPLPDGATVVETQTPDAALVHLFVLDRSALEAQAATVVAALQPKAMLWISWPKKSSKRFVDLTEDGVRELVLPTGWVDVKVAAVDEDWSGLKFLKRKA
ncbi:MAG: DUF3052 domain-containing protein [Proteobacteria bacterium]|nr:DUF3052 domain-containing protein [Pseudomonadota bacterium]